MIVTLHYSCIFAKIAGIKLCQAYRRQHGSDFISAMPTNMYGPNDNYDLQNSHVLPALIRKSHEAKAASAPAVTCWGTGSPLREFLDADDLAGPCVHLMNHYSEEQFINVDSGSDVTIKDLAHLVRDTVGYAGDIVWDPNSKPDGTPRKLMDQFATVRARMEAQDLAAGRNPPCLRRLPPPLLTRRNVTIQTRSSPNPRKNCGLRQIRPYLP